MLNFIQRTIRESKFFILSFNLYLSIQKRILKNNDLEIRLIKYKDVLMCQH